MLVELGVEGVVCSISLLRPPAGEGGCFIVDEYPAVPYARLAVSCRFIEDIDLVVLRCGYVSPEMQSRSCELPSGLLSIGSNLRRFPHLLCKREYAVHGTSLVTSGY